MELLKHFSRREKQTTFVAFVPLRVKYGFAFNSLPASSDLFRLLINFANSLDLDQEGRNVSPDPDPNYLRL